MDLTSLHHLGALVQDARAGTGRGQPLAIALDKIIPGENPRTTFDDDYLHRLAASIQARGVKTPISVQPVTADEVALSFGRRGLVPPVDLDGFYKINHGECRYRASVIANQETIPAMLDEQHDGIDALVENMQRKDLDPLDIAHAIQQKVNQGWKKADIAREIGFSASYVSNHLKLLMLPDPIAALIREGKSQDVTALLLLASAYQDFPEKVAAFCTAAEELTQAQVRRFVASLHDAEPIALALASTVQRDAHADAGAPATVRDDDDAASALQGASSTPNTVPETGAADAIQAAKPAAIKVVGVEVRHAGRPARLLLKPPSTHGLAWIRYDDGGQEREIAAGTIEQVVSVATA